MIKAVAIGFLMLFSMQVLAGPVGDTGIDSKDSPFKAPPFGSVEKVNNYVVMSMQLSEEQLKNSGKIKCRFPVLFKEFKDYEYVAYDNSPEMAHARVGMLCIKNRCNNLYHYLTQSKSEPKLQDLEPDEIRAYMRAQGYSEEKIETFIKRRHEPVEIDPNISCLNTPQDMRDLIYMSCFYTPIECSRK